MADEVGKVNLDVKREHDLRIPLLHGNNQSLLQFYLGRSKHHTMEILCENCLA